MNRLFYCIVFIIVTGLNSFAQERKPIKEELIRNRGIEIDTSRTNRTKKNNLVKNAKAKIEDYKIISFLKDTTFLDTTLSIKKEYKFNVVKIISR